MNWSRWVNVVSLGALAMPAAAQSWHERFPGVQPDGRVLHAMAYHLGADRVVLFGGLRAGLVADAGTWLWDGASWLQAAPAVSPSPRFGHAMAYDAVHGRVVLFGGSSAFGANLDETWTFDGVTWHQHAPSTRPSARHGSSMAFDHGTGRVVLFGGAAGSAYFADTWGWDGTNWLPVFTASAPSPRYAHSMVFDTARGRIVLFGGRGASGSWLGDLNEWDGGQWLPMQPASPPADRFHHGMVFDAMVRRALVFGGDASGQLRSDTWSWDGVAWTEHPIAAPPARYEHAMAYDLRSGRTVLFGGGDGLSLLADTWEFDGGSPAPVATATPFGVGCGSPPLTIAPAPSSRPLLGGIQTTTIGNVTGGLCLLTFGSSSSNLGPVALPIALAAFGMVGCRVYHDMALAVQSCSPSGPTTATHSLPIPADPGLIGARLYLQAWASLPAANPVGIATSNAAELVLGNL